MRKRSDWNSWKVRHGQTVGGSKSPAYVCWSNMRARCYNERHPGFKNYGARGIKVCVRWRESFDNFLHDMGHPKAGYELDRIDVNGIYKPKNCRWIPAAEQTRNARSNIRVSIKGQTKCLAEWAREFGVDYETTRARIRNLGWDAERALTTPIRKFTWRVARS